jgi:protoheme ferro-lyase
MRKQTKEQQISAELTEFFEQARQVKCPPSMKQNLYAQIGLNQQSSWFQSNWFKPALAFSFVAVLSLGLVWQNHNQLQQDQLATAERDMQIAMHYMQKISAKTLEDANTHGIKPAIIVPVSRSMSQMSMAQI